MRSDLDRPSRSEYLGVRSMPITISVPSAMLPANAKVIGVTARQALSQTYAFKIAVQTEHEHAVLADLVAARTTLKLPGPDRECAYHGIIRTAELLHAWGESRLMRLTMVPALWQLSQTLHSRVFVDLSVNEIVAIMLDEHGIQHRLAITGGAGQHPSLPHVCQYRESDLQFMQRLLEREGSYYYFDHSGDQEELVIEDRCSAEGGPTLTYAPGAAADTTMSTAYFDSFICRHQALPGGVEITGYNDQKPKLQTLEQAKVAPLKTTMSLFNEAHVHDVAQPAALLDVRAEEIKVRGVTYEGHGEAYGVLPGFAFAVTGHPVTETNQIYVATSVELRVNEAVADPVLQRLLGIGHAANDVQVQAIARDVQFRPKRSTPQPRIEGVETAVVESTGDDKYAHLDEHGRYLIRMHFDERGRRDSTSNIQQAASTWVRMMQPHAGAPEGAHFPLRAGTGVMFVFLGGDPDRPVIAGAVPNPVTPSVVVAATHTRNALETGSQNRLMMEDLTGSERVELSSPAENTRIGLGAVPSGAADGPTTDDLALPGIRMRTDANLNTYVKQDHEELIEGDETIEVRGDHDGTYLNNHDTDVTGDVSLTVGGDVTLDVKGNLTEHIEGDVKRVFESTTDLIYAKAYSTSYVSAVNENYASAVNSNYVSAVNMNYLSAVNKNYAALVNTNYVALVMNNYVAGVNNNYIGAFMSNYVAAVNNNYLAVVMNNYVAATNNNYLAATVNMCAAATLDIRAAASITLDATAAMTISAALKLELWAGLKMDLGLGVSISALVGFKLEDEEGKLRMSSFDCHV